MSTANSKATAGTFTNRNLRATAGAKAAAFKAKLCGLKPFRNAQGVIPIAIGTIPPPQ